MESNNNNKAMSREEELQQEANEWAEFFYKYSENMYDYISVRIAFKEGAAWADKHPKNVWHDASEMPKDGEWTLIQFDDDSYNALLMCDTDEVIFCSWCKGYGAIRWAYISDLLPKGGE